MKTQLDKLNESLIAVKEFNKLGELNIMSCLSFGDSHSIERTGKNQDQIKDILDWFIDGGALFTHSQIKRPSSERKTSKKRTKTTWFVLKKGELKFQIGHETIDQNFERQGWDHILNVVVNSWLTENEPLGYYNHGMLKYVLDKGIKIVDEGTVIKE